MNPTVTKGLFISFEGGDGSGKSTQVNLLADWLRSKNYTPCLTREPGGSSGAEVIRDLLVNGPVDRWSPITEALLMFAARTDHIEKTILPALKHGEIVITDRFVDSSMAYQGIAGELGKEFIQKLSDITLNGLEPDLTFVLDLPEQAGLSRAIDRGNNENRFEQKGTSFQANVRQAFLKIATDNPDRCILIDATGSIETIAEQIKICVQQALDTRR